MFLKLALSIDRTTPMHYEKVNANAFSWLRKSKLLLVVLFYSKRKGPIHEIENALREVSPFMGNFEGQACALDIDEYPIIAVDCRTEAAETPKLVLFLAGRQKFGFSALDENGDPLTSEEIRQRIIRWFKQKYIS